MKHRSRLFSWILCALCSMVMVLLGGLQPAEAQTVLKLEQCLELAVNNNIQAQISANNVESSAITYMQKKFDFLPNVAINVPVNKSFGNSSDPYTQQIAVSPWTSNPTLGATFVAFRGLSKWNDLRSSESTLSANRYSLEDLKNDIRLNTSVAFFQVMFAADNVKLSATRLELLEKQLENLQRQVDVGAKTQGDIYSLQSQLATERVNMVTQQNVYDRSLLNLVLTLNLDPSQTYVVERPPMMDNLVDELEDINSVFQSARLGNPGIRNQEFRALAAKYAINTARAAYFPTLNLTFGLGSFYSSNAKKPIGYTVIDNFPSVVYGPRIAMGTQFKDNFNKYIGLTLSVPIFNRMLTRQNYLISKVNQKNATLNLQSEEIELYKAIQQAHLDAKAADAKFAATELQKESLNEALRYAQARYDAGMLDFVAYLEVLNNSTRAEIEQVQAHYDRILKRKILDLYQGKPLTF